jgi:Mrp family chromosome partitioning ATPase
LHEQVGNLEKQIREETAKVLESLKTAARVAAARENSLVKSLNEAKGDVSRSNDQSIELQALEREAAAQRDLLESFLARYREAAARTDANYLPADARIISQAVAPSKPSFPKKTMMAIAAAVATLLLASVIVLLSEFMSGRAFRVIGEGAVADAPQPLRPVAPLVEARVAETEVVEPDEPKIVPAERTIEPARSRDQDRDAVGATPPVAPAAEPSDEVPTAASVDDVRAALQQTLREEAANEMAPPPALAMPPAPTSAAAPPATGAAAPELTPDPEKSGTEGLGDIVASSAVRVALFAGAEGGEGTGAVAFSAARQAAKQKVRCVVIDAGRSASEVLGYERPGLGELLAGEASFGEVIQRDDTARVHVIPLGGLTKDTPMQRMRLVIGALTHTYDKVIVVADKVDDWPDEYVTPDIAAIVCGAETSESLRTELYDFVLARGAHSAVIVRYSDFDLGGRNASAAA